MVVIKYPFADLLQVFYALRPDRNSIRTYEDLALAVGVTRHTITNWVSGLKDPGLKRNTVDLDIETPYSACLHRANHKGFGERFGRLRP